MEHKHSENCNHTINMADEIKKYATDELNNIGLLQGDKKAVGEATLYIIQFVNDNFSYPEVLSPLTLALRLMSMKPLTEIEQPKEGEYIVYPKRGENTKEMWQHIRYANIVSFDNGQTWAILKGQDANGFISETISFPYIVR